MNFIGKIFVVFIFIMSIMFMTLAAVVYSTHQNWQEKERKARQELSQAQTTAQQMESDFNRIKSELEAQKEASLQQVRKLESERDTLAGQTTNLQREVDELRGQWAAASAAVESTQRSSNLTAEENQQLRKRVTDTLAKSDEAINKALDAEDRLHNTMLTLEVAVENRAELQEEVARMTSVMQSKGLDPQTPLDNVTPKVDGFVQAVARRGSNILIQVSIGSDDGLREGHIVEIFRGSKYLGRAEILKTEPDRAIGRVDPRYQEGRIQEADRVATRLKLS